MKLFYFVAVLRDVNFSFEKKFLDTLTEGVDWVFTVLCTLMKLYFVVLIGDVIFSLSKGKYLCFHFIYSFIWKIVYTIYFGYLDKLSLTYEISAWFLLDYRLLKFLFVPEDNNSLLW